MEASAPKPKKSRKSSSKHLHDLLLRYSHVPEYAPDQRHNYHSEDACGPEAGVVASQSMRMNGILCEYADYDRYTAANPAPPDVREKAVAARKKACLCEVQRGQSMQQFVDRGERVDPNHQLVYEIAGQFCFLCAKIERDIAAVGYVRDRADVEKYETAIKIMFALEELTRPENAEAWLNGPGDTRREKLTRYMWDVYFPAHDVLINLRKKLTLSKFRTVLKDVDIALTSILADYNRRITMKQKTTLKGKVAATKQHLALLEKKGRLFQMLLSMVQDRQTRKKKR